MVVDTGPLIDQEIQVPAILLLQLLTATATPVDSKHDSLLTLPRLHNNNVTAPPASLNLNGALHAHDSKPQRVSYLVFASPTRQVVTLQGTPRVRHAESGFAQSMVTSPQSDGCCTNHWLVRNGHPP